MHERARGTDITPLTRVSRRVRSLAYLAAASAVASQAALAQSHYLQTNLVSDIPGLAITTDASLINPWGIAFSATSPFWVANAGTATSTLYNGAGTKQALVVSIPGPGSPVPGVPTGTVFNSASAFQLANGSNATFLFASATGTISGWNNVAGTNAVTMVNNFFTGASYTGLAIAGSGATARLYAANFGNNRVDVFDGNFVLQSSSSFVDPTLPAGYAPFNVQNLGGQIYVTYALKNTATGKDQAGAGNGFVDVFNTAGVLQRRLVSQGVLNSPWGVTIAPSSFGTFGNAVLVGNFGDGRISGFDATTGAFLGQITDVNGAPIINSGLWGITFGNGGNGGSTSTLYFAAGINNEQDGLFGSLSVLTTPEPGSFALMGAGLLVVVAAGARRRKVRETLQ